MSDSEFTHDLEAVLPGGRDGRKRPFAVRLRQWLKAAFLENFALKFVAFVLALTVFILVHSEEDATIRTYVGVSYSSLEDRVLVSERVDQVKLTIRGSRRRIKRFNETDLENIHINLRNMTNGSFRLTEDMFDIPEGLELIDIEPKSIDLGFEKRVEKRVPVVVDHAGTPERGYKISKIEVTPETVEISGAQNLIANIEEVRTREIDLSGRSETFTGDVPLVTEGFETGGAGIVTVKIGLVEELEARSLGLIDVGVRPAPGLTEQAAESFGVTPSRAEVVLFGSYNIVQAADPSELEIFVELTAADVMNRRARRVEIDYEPQLPGVAVKISPSEVTLAPR